MTEETPKEEGFDMIILGGGLGALAAGYAATKQACARSSSRNAGVRAGWFATGCSAGQL